MRGRRSAKVEAVRNFSRSCKAATPGAGAAAVLVVGLVAAGALGAAGVAGAGVATAPAFGAGAGVDAGAGTGGFSGTANLDGWPLMGVRESCSSQATTPKNTPTNEANTSSVISTCSGRFERRWLVGGRFTGAYSSGPGIGRAMTSCEPERDLCPRGSTRMTAGEEISTS